jgi:hypothetical protein
MAEVPPAAGKSPDRGTTFEPAKVLRLAGMVRQVLDELRRDGVSDVAGPGLRGVYRRSLDELGAALNSDLRAELDRLVKPLADEGAPSGAEIRLAEAQLAGWLDGLFQGMQLDAMIQRDGPVPAAQAPAARNTGSSGSYL